MSTSSILLVWNTDIGMSLFINLSHCIMALDFKASWEEGWSDGGWSKRTIGEVENLIKMFDREMLDIGTKLKAINLKWGYIDLALVISRINLSIELEEIRMYCLTELSKLIEWDLAAKVSGFCTEYDLGDEEALMIKKSMEDIRNMLGQKFAKLVNMQSIWYPQLKSSDFQFQETRIPTLLTKAWVGIPKEGKWKELSDFVEFVWLTIAMKEYKDAMKIITLSLQIRLKVERGITPISI